MTKVMMVYNVHTTRERVGCIEVKLMTKVMMVCIPQERGRAGVQCTPYIPHREDGAALK